MKMKGGSGRCSAFLVAAVLCSPALSAEAVITRTQTLALQAGWNAVFLEVEPMDGAPNVVFAGTSVDIAVRFFAPHSSVQFIRDPADAPWNQPGWGVWYAPNRPDAFLTSLHAIQGGKAYLLHATSSYTWSVTGRARFDRLRWRADSFNLVGFALAEQAPPTFERFFAGSAGRIGRRIYRLGPGGKWQPVTAPATTLMRAGEAYWVYCQGSTDYQGPLDLVVSGGGELDFGTGTGALSISLHNRSPEPITVSLEPVAGSGDLPLVRVRRDPATFETSFAEVRGLLLLSDLPPGGADALWLRVQREAMTASDQGCLLRLTSSQGQQFHIPVRAQRATFSAQP